MRNRSAQIPSSLEPAVNNNGILTVIWFTFLQNLYKICRLDIPLRLGGVLNINYAPVSNISPSSDLMAYQIGKNIINNDGDYLEIEVWGIFANNANVKSISLVFGSQTLYTIGPIAFVGGAWYMKAKIIRTTAISQNILVQSSTGSFVNIIGTQNLENNILVKCIGAGSNGDVTQESLIIKLSPNN